LFKPDDVLDNILIDDELLYNHTKKLSEYDFESEVDVNILGHIFVTTGETSTIIYNLLTDVFPTN
jgi:hypothetical protein